MQIDGWKCYKHAAIPTTPPGEKLDITPIKNGSIWKMEGTPLFARWVTEFDCGHETNWWYVIKDDEYDIQSLKAKRRYEITKARKNFDVKLINPDEYCNELFDVQIAAFSAYPEKYRPTIDLAAFKKDMETWNGMVFAAFSKSNEPNEKSLMCGYAYLELDRCRANFIIQKTMPDYEKYGVNAALVDAILTHFNDELKAGKIYVSDGQRSVNHETAFQDYLEKYFGFRKAYCRLNIVYHPLVRLLIPILYIMRKPLQKFDNIGLVHMINAIMKMEEINRGK